MPLTSFSCQFSLWSYHIFRHLQIYEIINGGGVRRMAHGVSEIGGHAMSLSNLMLVSLYV